MKPFTTFTGIVAPIERANIDTDQIIPKQFLKSIKRTGFGESLFFDWRYLSGGKPNPEFALNRPVYQHASILLAGNNFGCGSSREHAVWAIQQFGFLAVIAPAVFRDGIKVQGFADIFKNNCVKNGLLTIELPESDANAILREVNASPGVKATIDLEKQEIRLHAKKELAFHFSIDASIKETLLKGLDDIALTLQNESAIGAFEAHYDAQIPLKINSR